VPMSGDDCFRGDAIVPTDTLGCRNGDEDQRSDLASVQLLLAELSGSQGETIPFEDHQKPWQTRVALLLNGDAVVLNACGRVPALDEKELPL
jgi:hypothetical protein